MRQLLILMVKTAQLCDYFDQNGSTPSYLLASQTEMH